MNLYNDHRMKAGIDYPGVAVGVLVLNNKGEIFLTKRGKKATNERGTWEIPGGKVDFGETLQDAARREMKEEYGVDISLTYQLPAQNHLIPEEKQHWVPTCFISHIAQGQSPQILEPEKCEAIGWFSLNDLPSPLSIITMIDIRNYQKYLSGTNVFSLKTI